jgi:HK97 family phage portal protein
VADLISLGRLEPTKAPTGIYTNQNDPQGLLSGIMPGGLGLPPNRGTAEYLKAYSEMPWLRAVASRVATATASTQWKLFVRKKGGERARRDRVIQRTADYALRTKLLKQAEHLEDLTEVTDHPLLTVLHDANSFQTGEQMRKVTQLHLDLVGEAFWLKERDGMGVVVGVWPIPPHWVINTPTPANPLFRVQFRAWRGMIPDTEILWFSDSDPLNPYGRGSGTAQSLADELEIDEYAAKHTKAFYFNRARPDLLVWPKQGQVHQSQVDRLEERWLSQAQGFWRAFKPYFLTREVGVQELEQNFRSQQLVQIRDAERNAVIQTFGMPPELLGVLQESNRATITAADYLFSRYVVQPRLEFQRGVLQERLVPEYDERLIVHYESPVQRDEVTEMQSAQAAPYALSIDEWRSRIGVEPLKGDKGSKHVFQQNTYEHEIGADDAPKPAMPGGGGGANGQRPKPPAQPERAIRVRDEDGTLWREPEDKGYGPREVAADQEAQVERGIMDAWLSAERVVDGDALEAACEALDEDAMVAALAPEAEDRLLRAELEPRLVRAFMLGAMAGAGALRRRGIEVRDAGAAEKRASISLDAVNPEAVAWARRHAAELMNAPAHTRARVRNLVARAHTEGITPKDLARLLRQFVGLTPEMAESVLRFREKLRAEGVAGDRLAARVRRYGDAVRARRAETIARTELIASTNGGQQALWEVAVREGHLDAASVRRVWIVTDDERLEAGCEALDGAEVGLREEFEPGLMHPPKHPRCRCAIGLTEA